ncbi:unnamed protein product [Bursaphelenchus xylophilus]|uniref:(pine wood nematode) hypothetical protein n=1 Tax=Bursaphelenchus xylophilus TaxID=6326 RepID=A0A1I7SSB2_BURXY|nr:unnamed protein product [Bursaphelenchus xylophilus]CAG9097783.1 unnamed protein product [Bursaphelenchus xylophilus]
MRSTFLCFLFLLCRAAKSQKETTFGLDLPDDSTTTTEEESTDESTTTETTEEFSTTSEETTTTTPCCPTGGVWSNWRPASNSSCSDTCGGYGTQQLTRTCLSLLISSSCSCDGNSTSTGPCNLQPCAFGRASCAPGLKVGLLEGSFACLNVSGVNGVTVRVPVVIVEIVLEEGSVSREQEAVVVQKVMGSRSFPAALPSVNIPPDLAVQGTKFNT